MPRRGEDGPRPAGGGIRDLPRFWLGMQIVIVICVLISAVIVLVRL